LALTKLAFRLLAKDFPRASTSPKAATEVMFDLTGVLLILMFSLVATTSDHFKSNVPTSP